MTENPSNPIGPNESTQSERQLESWKEIAVYLGRDVSTVRRWEKYERLPVRRHLHQARSSVYAYPSELDAWREARAPGLDNEVSGPVWRRPVPAFGLTLALLLALVSFGSGPLLTPPNALAQGSDGMTVRRAWERAADLTGGPSPDGRYFSFVDWETGDLAVRDLKTGKNRRLTNKGSWFESMEFAYFPTISPSGKRVAYAWSNTNKNVFDLRLVGLDGSDPRVLYSNEEVKYLEPAAWSADGEHILAAFSKRDRTNQIVLVSVADGSVRVLKTLDWRWPEKMSLSPDGRYIVYDFPPQEDSPNRDIFLLATDGSREIPLVQHPANDLLLGWAPDGKRILFASDRTGTLGAWVIQVADGKPQGAPELVKPDMGRRILPMGFTRRGSYYYGLYTGMNDVYVATLDLATGKLLTPPTKATQRFVGSNYGPAWSPDGKYLAYISQRGHSPYGFGEGSRIISIRSVKTGEEREISPKLNRVAHPNPQVIQLSWSPDGRSFLVTGSDKKGRRGIYQIEAQTGDVTTIVQTEPGEYLRQVAWSPDGEAIYYRHYGTGSSRILVRNLETGREKELYRAVNPSSLKGLAVSPDGGQLAFAFSDAATRSDVLMVMPAAGGEPRELLRMQKPEGIPLVGGITWTPDSRELIFGKSEGSYSLGMKTTELWRISAQGGEPQKLELAMDGLRNLRFHPDGRQIAFTAGEPFAAEVWVLENFLPKSAVKTARLEE